MTEQEIALELRRLRRSIVSECVSIVERNFANEMQTMKSRTQQEQNIIGGFITVIESDIKNEMKQLI